MPAALTGARSRRGLVVCGSGGVKGIRFAVEGNGGVRVDDDADEVFTERRVSRSRGLAARAAGCHEQTQGLGRRRQIELGRDDLEHAGDAGAGVAEELCADGVWLKVQAGALAADLEDELGRAVVDVGAGVVDPAREVVTRG